MPREIVTLGIGGAGCNLSLSCWELFCLEHNIDPTGKMAGDTSVGLQQDPYNTFFHESDNGEHVPRAVMMDTDYHSKNMINGPNSMYRRLFPDQSVLCYKQDCKSNYFEGVQQAQELKIAEETMEGIRKQVERCGALQGFYMFRAMGGGTGGGVGNKVLEDLRDEWLKECIVECSVYPGRDFSSCVVEPYNCLLAGANSFALTDLTFLMDNQASYKVAKKKMAVQHPTFDHINGLLAQVVSITTSSQRFASTVNANLDELAVNLKPMGDYKYCAMGLAPIAPASAGSKETFSTSEIVNDAFNDSSIMCDTGLDQGGGINKNRYLAFAFILRGFDTVAGKQQVTSVTALQSAIQSKLNPKSSRNTNFPKFAETFSSYKLGVVGSTPVTPKNFLAPSQRQGCLLANNTCIRSLLLSQYKKALGLMWHDAFMWQYIDAGGTKDDFTEAVEGMRDILDSYEDILDQACENENTGNANNNTGGASQIVGNSVGKRCANRAHRHTTKWTNEIAMKRNPLAYNRTAGGQDQTWAGRN